MFTRVLKGHIALSAQIFPAGTPGCLLDALARQHLWEIGADYAHGIIHIHILILLLLYLFWVLTNKSCIM